MHTGAGHDQIPHTGKPGKGFGTAAHSKTQAGQLGVAAGDQSSLGVVAVAKPQRNADSQGNDILDGTAQLRAAAVCVGVDAEVRGVEHLLHGLGGIRIVACRHDQRGHIAGDLLGMGGTGQCHHAGGAVCLCQLVLDDLAHRHQGLVLNTLGDIHDDLPFGNMGGCLFGGGTHKRRRHRKQQDVPPRAGFGNIGGIVHTGGQLHAGQVRVAAGFSQGFQLGRDRTPHRYIAAVGGEQPCQSNAPGTGSEYSDFGHLESPYLADFCHSPANRPWRTAGRTCGSTSR